MSQRLGDLILRDWEFADYGEQRALLNPITSLQAKLWQSFEKFFTSFRCIKSAVIEENESTSISEVHAGARLNGDIQFKNHNLQLEVAKHHTDTRSKTLIASEWNVDCYNSTVDIRKFKHCIINPVSPYGDSFLSLDQLGTESLNEIHQFKLRKKAVSKKEYQEKHEKFASENDFFILFTTANCNIEISKRSGIVDRNAFMNYFGPFAERAYRSAMANPFIYNNKVKNIHTVSLGQIRNMNQISKEQLSCSLTTAKQTLYDAGIHSHVAAKKPFISKRYASARISWYEKYKEKTTCDWVQVIFSDESSIEIEKQLRQIRVWRHTGERFNTKCLTPIFKSGQKSVMVRDVLWEE
ncbi:unnamed protein product [Rhizophagus irregularis]|uniref:Uncharacterized protein n=1 Tax=Rhizophagus irregularis TaxID=588596 RepID=A0A915ZYV1_9GLOM|nr:unnamed protein product [Rhizophagus irregularis]